MTPLVKSTGESQKEICMKRKLLVLFSLTGLLCLAAPSSKADAAWELTSQGRRYTTSSTSSGYYTGWKTIGKYTYYFNSKGYAQTGWRLIQKKWYFFDTKGRLLTNRWVDGYYLSADGSVTQTASQAKQKSASVTSGSKTGSVKNGWVKKDGKYYYYDYAGNVSKGWLTIQDKTYYLDPSTGERKTGVVRINKKYYYFDTKTGEQETGWRTWKGNRYFFSRKTKNALTGWNTVLNKYYYFSSSGKLQKNKWIGSRYYVDSSGRRVYGWQRIGSKTYYFHSKTGKKVKGWRTIDGKAYFFNPDGSLNTTNGIITVNSKKYYLDPESNARKTGWVTYHGRRYYFDPKTKTAVKGWKKIDGEYYYFNSKYYLLTDRWISKNYHVDENGKRQYGWITVDGKTYYLNPKTGKKVKGLKRIDGKRYYFQSDGSLATTSGFLEIDGETYYLDSSTNTLSKGWKKVNQYYYYFNSGYTLSVGPKWINSYYINAQGQRQYGWLTLDGATYYLNPSTGKKTTGWTVIDGKTYHFSSSGKMDTGKWVSSRYLGDDGVMLVSQWVGRYYVGTDGRRTGQTRSAGLFTDTDGSVYYLNSDYTYKVGWITISGKKYFFDRTTGKMLKSQWYRGYYFDANGVNPRKQFLTINGQTFYFNSTGKAATGLCTLNGKTFYFNSDGSQVTGLAQINGNTYYFDPDKNGAMTVSDTKTIGGIVYTFNANGVAYASGMDSSNSTMGAAIAAYAQQFIGEEYEYGPAENWDGELPYTPTDCSGFVMGVFAHFNISVPRVAADQANGYNSWDPDGKYSNYAKAVEIRESALMPGDLVFYYTPIGHVGIYIGNGKIVHASNSAPYPEGGVKVSDYDYTEVVKCVRYWQ